MRNMGTETKQQRNYGISILKIWMSFEVILIHAWDRNESGILLFPFRKIQSFAVPVFMLCAFFFFSSALFEGNWRKLGERIKRLFVPLLLWAVIYVLILNVFYLICGGDYLNFYDLLLQTITGYVEKINTAMWFQVDLIILTFIFFLLIRFFKGKFWLFASILFGLSLFLQYSGINYHLFESLPYEFKFPLGRLCEMIPVCIVGIFFAKAKTLIERKQKRYLFIALLLFLIGIRGILGYFDVIPSIEGYGSAGIDYTLVPTVLFGIFYLLPLEEIPGKMKTVITYFEQGTVHIYCIHILVLRLIMIIFGVDMLDHSFIECILIYVVCFLGSVVIRKIEKELTKMLFIKRKRV